MSDGLVDGILGFGVDIFIRVMFGDVVDMVSNGMIGFGVDILSETDVIVTASPATVLEIAVGVAYGIDVPFDLLAVIIIAAVRFIAVETLADEIVNDLASAIPLVEFASAAP